MYPILGRVIVTNINTYPLLLIRPLCQLCFLLTKYSVYLTRKIRKSVRELYNTLMGLLVFYEISQIVFEEIATFGLLFITYLYTYIHMSFVLKQGSTSNSYWNPKN